MANGAHISNLRKCARSLGFLASCQRNMPSQISGQKMYFTTRNGSLHIASYVLQFSHQSMDPVTQRRAKNIPASSSAPSPAMKAINNSISGSGY